MESEVRRPQGGSMSRDDTTLGNFALWKFKRSCIVALLEDGKDGDNRIFLYISSNFL